MSMVEGKDIEFNYGDKPLFRKASFKFNLGEHAVLVGSNGTGKTTLLNMITGELSPDKGSIIWEKGISFSYLDQQLRVKNEESVSSYLYGVYKNLFDLEKQMQLLYEEASLGEGDYEKKLEKAALIGERLDREGFYALQSKVGRLIDGLGFPASLLERPLSKLSSGQREKAYLAKMLLEEKDVLFMDEPTNFLDAVQVNWLASYLVDYPKAFLVVSHDQDFLEKIANVVFCLENQVITRYKMGFLDYLVQRELDKEQYKKNYEAQQRYIKKEEQFIAAHIVRATSSRAAKSRRARLSHLERMEAPSKGEGKVFFNFPFTKDVGKEVLEVNELEIGYDKPLLSPITFSLKKGEKIAIIGKNGVGKTTFLKTILGKLPMLSGSYHWLDGIVPSCFDNDEKIDLSLSPFELIKSYFPDLNNTEVRSLLGNVGVRKDLSLRPLSTLSGGEAAKARLAIMTKRKSNFLIFDEPTNHLDQKAKDALFEAIERFPGPVILVSHEKDFYDGLVDYELFFS